MPDAPQGQQAHPIFDRYPHARAFADLIVGDTEEDVEEMAREIDGRVRAVGAASTAAAPATPEPERLSLLDRMDRSARGPHAAPPAEAPQVPVIGGGTSYVQESAVQDRVGAAVRKRDFSGFLAAKFEEADNAVS